MPEMVGAIAGVASSAMGLFGGDDDDSDEYKSSVASSAQAQSAMAQELWQRYLNVFAPYEEKVLNEAAMPARESPGFLGMVGDINRQYGNQSANVRRALGGRYQYGSGMEGAAQKSVELNRTKALTGAESDWNANRFQRMLQASYLGNKLPISAMSGYGSAGSMYGNLANLTARQESEQDANLSETLSNLGSLFNMGNSNPSRYTVWAQDRVG